VPKGLPSGQLGNTLCPVGCLPVLECATKCPTLPGDIQLHLHLPNGPIRWQRIDTVWLQAPLVHRSSLDDVRAASDLLVCLVGSDVSRVQLIGQRQVGSQCAAIPMVDYLNCLTHSPLKQETSLAHGR